ncbi:MAG: DALR anticodon-binding domain-containing protein, partial [Candidatus Binatia bacterium]
FDFKEALSFEGETGCFCQYSAVRANSIFRKLEENGDSLEQFQKMAADPTVSFDIFDAESANEIWSLVVLASRLSDTARQASEQNEPAILAKYTFNLAKAFNLFYHHHKIIVEEDAVKRSFLVVVADMARRSLTAALATMGIQVPEKM